LKSTVQHKIVIITGASSGIGEATAYAFAARGCKLVLAARSMERLQKVKTQCEILGATVLAVSCDVSKEEECKALVDEAVRTFGTVHVLINNAGISMRAMLEDCDLDVIKQVMGINFWGSVYCTKFALAELLKNKGSILSVSSVSGLVGLPARTGYSASKYAIDGFMQSLRIENLKKGLHVGIIYPGYTSSNIRNAALNSHGESQAESPLDESKLMPASEVADTIVRMVIYRRRQRILTNLGRLTYLLNALAPGWVDRMVYNFVAKEKDSPFK
jgi:NAD(P)-dependent dehydrogenase (short-subunit alcohol dehydrogenase family)